MECKSAILEQAKKYNDYNVIVSPMNNKISTVSCALAAYDNENIQLAVAIPMVYNSEMYSTPGDYCYLIEIPEFLKVSSESYSS